MLTLTLFFVFCTVLFFCYAALPTVYSKMIALSDKRGQQLTSRIETMMTRKDARTMGRVFVFAPVLLAGLFFFAFPEELRLVGAVIGATGGFILPSVYIQVLTKGNREKFQDQLVDALMIMSSSFRGGLSLVQAMEAVVDEMPDPVNKEFGIVLGENKMGVSLEEALFHLYNRMPSNPLQQMITAILLARETGGNLPVIFNRIIGNIRENRKIQQNLDTLTIQGKLQGIVLAILPIGFAFMVYSTNRRIYDHMLSSQVGRWMLLYAVVSEVIGAILIFKISSFKEF